MDIIELALLRFTDFAKFEDLATELMVKEGFTSIHKIGGIGDDGIDAEQVQHYQDDVNNVVFQFSLQDNVSSKITATIKKLKDNHVEFSELIIVTNQQVNNKQDLRKKARTNHQVTLLVFDLSDLKIHLGANESIFNRYFPNIDTQLASLKKNADIFTEESANILEKSMLKCSLIFSFSESGREKNLQKHLLYKTILAILASYDEGKNETELVDFFLVKFSKVVSSKDIKDALIYLENEHWLHRDGGKYKATNKVIRRMSESIADIELRTDSLIKGIISSIETQCAPEKITREKEIIIANNIKQVFNSYFRLYGADCCGKFGAVEAEEVMQADIIKIATNELSENLSEWIVYFLGQLFSRPNEEQCETLSLWAKCYMGAQLMRLDPVLSEFQMENLKGKTFVLDTDFVLYSITDACKQSKAYKQIINVLVRSGCNVIIPDEIVREVAIHAASAEGNYKYFKSAFSTIDEEIVEEEMNNIFVKDYYLKVMRKMINGLSFNSYIDNYYDENDKERFMLEVINNRLKGVKIGGDFSSHNIISGTIKYDFIESINEELKKTPKAKHRTPEDNYELSRVDADLYLYVLEQNNDVPSDKQGNLLWGNYYLLTNSTRSARCAKKFNIYKNIVTNPTLIYGLIDEIGIFGNSKKNDVLDLFANPFLAHVVNENWKDMKAFADRGVYMKGREVPRLRRDFQGIIHTRLTEIEKLEDHNEEMPEKSMVTYVAFAKEIEKRGYKLVPSVQKQVDAFREKQDRIEEMEAQLDAINSAMVNKNKRQKRFLENVGKRAVNNIRKLRKK